VAGAYHVGHTDLFMYLLFCFAFSSELKIVHIKHSSLTFSVHSIREICTDVVKVKVKETILQMELSRGAHLPEIGC